ncbi:ribonuclease domain-containing protein [Bordetella avium]|nr:ribonuclease domain-containing protein [Bordetella avium]WQE35012.1 ribonuclease domain-containing protein [Bordetella avium]
MLQFAAFDRGEKTMGARIVAVSAAIAMFITVGSAQARGLNTCEAEIKAINKFLADSGVAQIESIASLARTVRHIGKLGRLPSVYITSDEAKRLGWSGKSSESLWGIKLTDQKWIGGDVYRNPSLPGNEKWYSADLDVVKGYRSSKRLVYNLRSRQMFISTDLYAHFVEMDACD